MRFLRLRSISRRIQLLRKYGKLVLKKLTMNVFGAFVFLAGSTPPRAAFSVPYKSGCPRSMDALDEQCFWGSCAAGRGRASPSEIPRRNVELHDQSGRALSPPRKVTRPAAQAQRNFLKQSS